MQLTPAQGAAAAQASDPDQRSRSFTSSCIHTRRSSPVSNLPLSKKWQRHKQPAPSEEQQQYVASPDPRSSSHMSSLALPRNRSQMNTPPSSKEQQPCSVYTHMRRSSLVISPPLSKEQQLCKQPLPPARGDTTAANSTHQRSCCQLRNSHFCDHPRSYHSLRSHGHPRSSPCTIRHLDQFVRPKMGRQRNPQRNEKEGSPEKQLSDTEACNMSEKEFRLRIVECINRMEEKINNLCKNQEEMKSDIAAIKNTMESFKSRLGKVEGGRN
uniref:Uncharacterized protein n=1 Tax=Myotis myotis TaxID=51298 RepID=A0A7J7ZXD5_MYOMY|nr:hypothetical protein mMyoMyo1_009835 [Myotis myotis]